MKHPSSITLKTSIQRTITLFILMPFSVYSDNAYLGTVGGNIFTEASSNVIQMINEYVYIKLEKKLSHVTCNFTFYNHSDSLKSIIVGFPDFHYSPSESTDSLRNFKCYLKDTLLTKWGYTTKQTKFRENGKKLEDWFGERWYIWIVDFPSKDTVKIRNEYDGTYGASVCEKSFVYTIGTGSSWFGPIINGKIVFDHSNIASDKFVVHHNEYSKLTPKYYEDSIVYTFSNYKPEKEEEVEIWLRSYWDFNGNCPNYMTSEIIDTTGSINILTPLRHS